MTNFKKTISLLGLLLINYTSAINPFLPDCLVNYTTYFNRYANESAINIDSVIKSVSGDNCAVRCNNLDNCTSFNYFPENIFYPSSQSKCELITTDFNSSLLIDKFYTGYYLKSDNNCIADRERDYLILAIGLISLVFIFSLCCYCCCCKKNNRSQYYRIN